MKNVNLMVWVIAILGLTAIIVVPILFLMKAFPVQPQITELITFLVFVMAGMIGSISLLRSQQKK